MSAELEAPFDVGETQPAGVLVQNVGMEKLFPNWDPVATAASPGHVRIKRDASLVRKKLVFNDSGGALLPCTAVKWEAAARGQKITAVCSAGDKCAGIVDEMLPAAGVPDQTYFWMTIRGQTQVLNDGGGSFSGEEVLVTSTSGQVVLQTAAPSTTTVAMVQVNSKVGVAAAACTATAGKKFVASIDLPFQG